MSSRFRPQPDRRCLRGLRWVVDLHASGLELDPASLADALAEVLPGALRGQEQLGPRVVERVILQFQLELRIGERPGQLALLYRSCCPQAAREQLLAQILARLDAAYDADVSTIQS